MIILKVGIKELKINYIMMYFISIELILVIFIMFLKEAQVFIIMIKEYN